MPAPRFAIRSIEIAEREVRFTHPFRFGAVTLHGAPQAFVHVEIALEDGRRSRGAAAELMVPKWFNKDPSLTPDETVEQLRTALALARKAYLARGTADTAFGHHAQAYAPLVAACAREGIPPLAAAYGPAEIDKAVLDALLRALGLDLFAGLSRNFAGLDARLTPDLDAAAISGFLSSRKPSPRIAVRHTVGMLDPLESIGEVHARTGCRYYKLKVGGDPAADRDRLAGIAETLAGLRVDYRATLDANEQYATASTLAALVAALSEDAALRPLAQRLLYIEQPLPRELTWTLPVQPFAGRFAFIVDEADDAYDAFPKALALGYRGISSKSCKGLYKSLLNGARCAARGDGSFVTAEDLTCQAGLAVQQDTALVAFHGVTHAERNGHHYGDGFAGTPEAEARAFLRAHPDFYRDDGGTIRLAIAQDGCIATGSLAQVGFASGVAPDLVGGPDAIPAAAAVGHR